MKVRQTSDNRLRFPVQRYFEQIFSNSTYVTIINPFKYWHKHKIEHLESCYEYNIIRSLESCLKKPTQPNQEKNSFGSAETREFPYERESQGVVVLSQPNFKLKYRGVSYRSNYRYITKLVFRGDILSKGQQLSPKSYH